VDHPALSVQSRIWSLTSVPQLRQFTYAIDDDAKRQLVEEVIDAFEREVLPNVAQFSAGCSIRLLKAPSTPATMSKKRSILSKQQSTLLPKTATMSNEFIECSFDIVAVFGNNVAG